MAQFVIINKQTFHCICDFHYLYIFVIIGIGRILVGHRWWNQTDGEGKSQWVFESKKGLRAGGRAPE